MSGFAERWAKNGDKYPNDIVLFAESQWVLRNVPRNTRTGPDGCIVLMDHQKIILREMTRRNPDGTFVYDVWIYSTIKKSGKTEIEGIVGAWLAMVEPGLPEIYTIANDKEQARTRAFEAIAQQIIPVRATGQPRNPVLASLFGTPRKDTIPIGDGGFLKTVATDYAGESGANPTASLWDELWGVERETQQRLWDEFTPVPTRLNSIRFVATYAGFRNESLLLWDLYQRIVINGRRLTRAELNVPASYMGSIPPIYVSQEGSEIAYWDTGEEARRMPWQTPAYYKAEKARLRPEAYARLHENIWQDNVQAFISAEAIDALPRYARRPGFENEDGYPVYIGVDAAHKRDSTTVAAIEYVPEGFNQDTGLVLEPRFRLVDHQIWLPTPGNVVIPEETALPWIRSRVERGWNVRGIGYDPAHFETAAAMMRREQIIPEDRIREITPSDAHLTALGSALYDTILYGRLDLDEDSEAICQHIRNAMAVRTARGWRLSKGKEANKIDGAVACGICLLLAIAFGHDDAESHSPIYFVGVDDDDF
jgi:phage terminase large subunit-like protein